MCLEHEILTGIEVDASYRTSLRTRYLPSEQDAYQGGGGEPSMTLQSEIGAESYYDYETINEQHLRIWEFEVNGKLYLLFCILFSFPTRRSPFYDDLPPEVGIEVGMFQPYGRAMHSISTSTFLGSCFTATQLLAGLWVNHLAYSSFMSFMGVKIISH